MSPYFDPGRPVDPTLTVLLYSSLAAASAGLGVVPLLGRRSLPTAWIGWANALAAGLMLGAAYAILVVGLAMAGVERVPLAGALGALLGVAFVYWTHWVSGTAELDLNRLHETAAEYGYQVILVNAHHAAAEGIAIGVAFLVSAPFGIFMALAIAVHNIPEATVLSAILTGRGARLGDAVGLSIGTNVSQVLLSIVTFAVVAAAPGLFPWALGFAVGALVYLVMAALLPECYRQAGPTSIGLVTIVAMGIVVLLSSQGL